MLGRREFIKDAAAGLTVWSTRSLLGVGPATASADLSNIVNVVAHEDDDLLFLSPDLLSYVQSGGSVRTVYITAGDGGQGSWYWSSRESGARAGYDDMLGGSGWTLSDAGVPGHPIPLYTSHVNPRVSHAYLRLPDGSADGAGFSATGFESLQQLWEGATPTLRAVDGSSSYTRAGLVSALTSLMQTAGADVVNTLDFGGSFGDGDHSDHHAAAYFAAAAKAQYAAAHSLVGYLGYPSQSRGANVSGAALTAKRNAFFAYIPYDGSACGSASSCSTGSYGAWLQRQYRTDGAPPNVNTAPVAQITSLDPSSTWAVGQQIAFAGRGTDAQDGTLPASRMSWRVELMAPGAGFRGDDLMGPGQTFAGVAGGTFTVPSWEAENQVLRVALTVTDSSGATDTEEAWLDALTSQVVLESTPGGLPLVVDGVAETTPVTRELIVGTSLTVAAPASAVVADGTFTFDSWSNGGATTQVVVAPPDGVRLVAAYAPPPAAPDPPAPPDPPATPSPPISQEPPPIDPRLKAFFEAIERDRQRKLQAFFEAIERDRQRRLRAFFKALDRIIKAAARRR